MIKFLVIRFSSIGDIVLTSPVVRIIKQQIPDSVVHFLTKQEYSSIVSNNKNIDKIHLLSKENLLEIIQKLKYEHYDYIIDLHNNIRTYKIKSKLKVPDFTFDKLNYKKWIYVNFKKNLLTNIHIVDRYLQTLSVFNIKNDNLGLDFFIHKNDKINLSKYLENNEKFISIVIGAKHFTKKMPNNIIVDLINKLNYKVVLLGGKDDVDNANEIINNCKREIINFCGKLNINESASVLQQSTIVISHDTGLMHIASALKKDIISIWGNTVPEFGMYPYLPGKKSKIFQVEGLKCRPCSKIGFKKCPKNHFNCMQLLNIKDISEYINNI